MSGRRVAQWGNHAARLRARQLVGREAERRAFADFLQHPSYRLLHICGPFGIGKTALLDVLLLDAEARNRRACRIDAARIEPDAEAVGALLWAHINANPGPLVIGVDAFDTLAGLYDVLRERVLPALPDRVALVTTGRQWLPERWRTELGWQALLKSIELNVLTESEAELYLQQRAVPETLRPAIGALAGGLPLTLAACADSARADAPLPTTTIHRRLHPLLVRQMGKAPTSAHRRALWLSALVWKTTDALVEDVCTVGMRVDPHAVIDWLAANTAYRWEGGGLAPRLAYRNLLALDIEARDPQLRRALIERATDHLLTAAPKTDEADLEATVFALLFVHRRELGAAAEDLSHSRYVAADTPTADELEVFFAAVRDRDGDAAERCARAWNARHPRELIGFRSPDGAVAAFIQYAAWTSPAAGGAPEERVTALLADGGGACLREGERVQLARFLVLIHDSPAVRWRVVTHLVSRLAVDGPAVAAAVLTEQQARDCEQALLERLGAFELGGVSYQLVGVDWRRTVRLEWLRANGVALLRGRGAVGRTHLRPVALLERRVFEKAVEEAFKHFHSDERLRDNALLDARLVLERASGPGIRARIETLRALVENVCAHLASAGEDWRDIHILRVTYLEASLPQLQAAERLNMAFSTYRRHLKRATARVARELWEAETGALP